MDPKNTHRTMLSLLSESMVPKGCEYVLQLMLRLAKSLCKVLLFKYVSCLCYGVVHTSEIKYDAA